MLSKIRRLNPRASVFLPLRHSYDHMTVQRKVWPFASLLTKVVERLGTYNLMKLHIKVSTNHSNK